MIGTDKLYSFSRSGRRLIQLGQQVTGAIGSIQNLNGKLFVATDYGIYKYDPFSNKLVLKTNGLTDHGQSLYWTRDIAAIDDILFCNVISKGIYKSADEGENWEKLDVSTDPASVEVEKNELTSGRMKTVKIIGEGDKIKILAEDGKNEKTLRVAKKELVTSVAGTEATLTLFPVPGKDILYFNHPEQIRSFSISDSRGKKISEQPSHNDYIDISTLPYGFYFITIVNSSNKREVFKFIKE